MVIDSVSKDWMPLGSTPSVVTNPASSPLQCEKCQLRISIYTTTLLQAAADSDAGLMWIYHLLFVAQLEVQLIT